MDRGLDSGPIVAQEGFTVVDGTTSGELELRSAAVGAGLLVAAARALADGTAMPRAQDEARATVHPWPGADAFVVTPDRPARWAYNFIRGTAGWGQPHRLALPDGAGGGRWTVRAALAYDADATLDAPVVREGDGDGGGAVRLRVRCAPGVLTVLAREGGVG